MLMMQKAGCIHDSVSQSCHNCLFVIIEYDADVPKHKTYVASVGVTVGTIVFALQCRLGIDELLVIGFFTNSAWPCG